jgi:hypothetical protein
MVREVTAHVAGIALEVNRHLDPYPNGDPVPATRSFEEREAPLRAITHGQLMGLLHAEEARMRGLVAAVLAERPDGFIPWTGRRMAVAKFIPHLRNEHALHRWDIVGGDELGDSLLGQADLTGHSVDVLGDILLSRGMRQDPSSDQDFSVRLVSDGARTIHVRVEDGVASMGWDGSASDEPGLVSDPAARLLLIWGRRAEGHGRICSHLTPDRLGRLQTLLSGY